MTTTVPKKFFHFLLLASALLAMTLPSQHTLAQAQQSNPDFQQQQGQDQGQSQTASRQQKAKGQGRSQQSKQQQQGRKKTTRSQKASSKQYAANDAFPETPTASSRQVRQFHEVLNDLLTEFSYDVKHGKSMDLRTLRFVALA